MDDFRISVTEPKKCQDTYTFYITYKIVYVSTRPGFNGETQEVIRRYSDFEWLSTELIKFYPGIIIPPLPEKQSVGNLTTEFVESRRRALEKFLFRIAIHPDLGYSTFFIAFLQKGTINEAKAEVKATKVDRPKQTKPGWFDSTVNTLTTGKKIELEKSAADIKIEEISQYISQLEKQMNSVTKHAEALTKSSRDISQAYFDLSQSFHWLSTIEGDTLGSALSWVANTTSTLSTSTQRHAEAETIKLAEPLEEYTRMMSSIKTAINQRHIKKQDYITCLIDLECKQNSYRKSKDIPGKEIQANNKEILVNTAQIATECSKLEFEKISEKLLNEFEIFKNQKAVDFKEIILNFVNLQIDLNQKSEQIWSDLIPEVEKIVIKSFDQTYYHSQQQQQNNNFNNNDDNGFINASTVNNNRISGEIFNNKNNNKYNSFNNNNSTSFDKDHQQQQQQQQQQNLSSKANSDFFVENDSDLSDDKDTSTYIKYHAKNNSRNFMSAPFIDDSAAAAATSTATTTTTTPTLQQDSNESKQRHHNNNNDVDDEQSSNLLQSPDNNNYNNYNTIYRPLPPPIPSEPPGSPYLIQQFVEEDDDEEEEDNESEMAV